jgi:hypothetical protein
MLTSKRTQIRTNIRRAELNQHFALKRRELIHGKKGLANEFFL